MTLEQLIDKVPQGYQWLLRSNEDGRFFCNISIKGYVGILGSEPPEGAMFKSWAGSPEEALQASIDLWADYAIDLYNKQK